MTKPTLRPTPEVRMAALMGQGLHVVTRPSVVQNGVVYVPLIHYHHTKEAAQEDYKFCVGFGSYHEYSAIEVLMATA